jgi:hypothetical protein
VALPELKREEKVAVAKPLCPSPFNIALALPEVTQIHTNVDLGDVLNLVPVKKVLLFVE